MTPNSSPSPPCTGTDSWLWQGRGTTEAAEEASARHGEARALCRECTVISLCLADRETRPSLGAGVWGGETFEDAA